MQLTSKDISLLVTFPCIMAAGQILFKLTAMRTKGLSLYPAFQTMAVQPIFYLALAVYGAATVIWIWLLSRYSLAIAYPFAVLAVIFVPLLESVFFGSRTTPLYWLGMALVITGVLIITRAQAN